MEARTWKKCRTRNAVNRDLGTLDIQTLEHRKYRPWNARKTELGMMEIQNLER